MAEMTFKSRSKMASQLHDCKKRAVWVGETEKGGRRKEKGSV
jgi:hypothetical protein